jgi:hypothetical protein
MSEREPTRAAQYVGTEIGGKWWKRYRAPGFFARGNGAYWFEDGEIRFHRALTSQTTRIPLALVSGVSIGTWHAGAWLAGKPVVKVAWSKDGEPLSSGFGFGDRPSAEAFAAEVESRRSGSGG